MVQKPPNMLLIFLKELGPISICFNIVQNEVQFSSDCRNSYWRPSYETIVFKLGKIWTTLFLRYDDGITRELLRRQAFLLQAPKAWEQGCALRAFIEHFQLASRNCVRLYLRLVCVNDCLSSTFKSAHANSKAFACWRPCNGFLFML